MDVIYLGWIIEQVAVRAARGILNSRTIVDSFKLHNTRSWDTNAANFHASMLGKVSDIPNVNGLRSIAKIFWNMTGLLPNSFSREVLRLHSALLQLLGF